MKYFFKNVPPTSHVPFGMFILNVHSEARSRRTSLCRSPIGDTQTGFDVKRIIRSDKVCDGQRRQRRMLPPHARVI